mmetsp:Transcript_106821/g.189843  ORF Transcript_106821/g.189843 Transcript_106821/m.189843 type:complete len:482 (-) Transcript_106821:109-1554(-)|eukprot:CAMPEP_0197661528 /NCGR_PEP_ID=MMETSP1338-20131121/51509_1 /TAXON_ID=43686 ORGANISM="Pelagodinium beii, Strain RCC1491" /NCGR_SAMPLE_ID=MMETSP1338 /ASSEMBLY_ACC=CAM_ASM_000754 /LENGTH=481 /DNA_ID=CAMNT_0043239097 /DNA_START=109 /DNA_END=1554 /DNA_ORIENTATION=+
MEAGKPFTVTTFIETVGLSTHQYYTISFVYLIFVYCGWSGTLPVYLLDAAAESDSDWTQLSSPQDRLTMEDRSWTLLTGSILAAFGNAFVGVMSDVVGRIITMEWCIASGALAAIGFTMVRSKLLLMVCFIINPFIKDGAAAIAQVLLAEWLPVRWRSMLIIALHGVWNVGRLAVTLLWVLLPPTDNWNAFVFAAAVPSIMLAVYFRFRAWQYESPRWLAVSGNMEQCISTLQLAATHGEEQLPHGWDNPGFLQVDDDTGGAVQAKKKTCLEQLGDLNTPDVRHSIVILSVAFFSTSFASGISFYWSIEYLKIMGLKAAIQPAMVLSPVGRFVTVALMIVGGPGNCIIDTWRRVPLMQIGSCGLAISMLVMCVLKNAVGVVAAIFLSNMFEEFLWTAGSVYAIEIFPTSVRSTAGSVIWTVASFGGILGTSLGGELMKIWPILPFLAAAFCLLTGAIACSFSKEERGDKALSDVQSYGAVG